MKELIAEKWSKLILFSISGRRKSKNSVPSVLLFSAPQFGLELD